MYTCFSSYLLNIFFFFYWKTQFILKYITGESSVYKCIHTWQRQQGPSISFKASDKSFNLIGWWSFPFFFFNLYIAINFLPNTSCWLYWYSTSSHSFRVKPRYIMNLLNSVIEIGSTMRTRCRSFGLWDRVSSSRHN